MSPSQFERIEDNAFKIHNLIQIELAGLYVEKPKPTNDEFDAWRIKYSQKFREIINNHPEYLALYAKDGAEALDKISEELYKDDEVTV